MPFQAMEQLLAEFLTDQNEPVTSTYSKTNGGNVDNDGESEVEDILADLSDNERGGKLRYCSNCRDLEWTDELRDVQVEEFTESSGPIHDLPALSEPIGYFSLFIPDSFNTYFYAEQ